jgi:hypothetical protein
MTDIDVSFGTDGFVPGLPLLSTPFSLDFLQLDHNETNTLNDETSEHENFDMSAWRTSDLVHVDDNRTNAADNVTFEFPNSNISDCRFPELCDCSDCSFYYSGTSPISPEPSLKFRDMVFEQQLHIHRNLVHETSTNFSLIGNHIDKPPTAGETKKRSRTISDHAKSYLEEAFQLEPYPEKEEMSSIAERANVTVKQARTWFANKRNRTKPQSRFEVSTLYCAVINESQVHLRLRIGYRSLGEVWRTCKSKVYHMHETTRHILRTTF